MKTLWCSLFWVLNTWSLGSQETLGIFGSDSHTLDLLLPFSRVMPRSVDWARKQEEVSLSWYHDSLVSARFCFPLLMMLLKTPCLALEH